MYACSGNTIPAGIRGVSFYLSFYAAGKRRKNMAFVIELLLIGVGLSMDAFAVAVCKGLAMRKVNKKQAVVIGLFFGGFQALMPFIGWALGTQFESYITSIDHWIAFILLAFIGGKMVVEGYRLEEDETVKELAFQRVASRFSISFHTFGKYPKIAVHFCFPVHRPAGYHHSIFSRINDSCTHNFNF